MIGLPPTRLGTRDLVKVAVRPGPGGQPREGGLSDHGGEESQEGTEEDQEDRKKEEIGKLSSW